jgi:hypothetical protein
LHLAGQGGGAFLAAGGLCLFGQFTGHRTVKLWNF